MARRGINSQVARLPGVQASVLAEGQAIKKTAKALAAGHGSLSANIKLERVRDVDVAVVLEHEAALSIETGHMDEVFGSGWVPGLHIMRDAALLAK